MTWLNSKRGITALCFSIGLSLYGCGGGSSDSGTGGASAAKASVAALASNTPSPPMPQIPVASPPMGWSSWNSLEENVSYNTIKAEADGLAALNANIASGPKYQYVNIDEGWWTSGQRDASGNFIVDTTQWPGGMQAMAQYIHSKGLKAGIYIDAGPVGCGTRANGTHFVGSDYAHYTHDFLQFAQWGYDFVKVDFCGGSSASYDPQNAYTAVAAAVQNAYAQTGHLLALNICDWGTIGSNSAYPDYQQGPWAWAPGLAVSWRTTGDIYGPNSGVPNFGAVTGNLAGNYHPEAQHTGYYNDPDMMIAGMGMSAVHDQAHVSLWALSGAPLILGNDLAKPVSTATIGLITNPEVIAIDQDALGVQGLLVAQSGAQQVWSRLLAGAGQRAVVLFNNTAADAAMTVTWNQLGLLPSSASVRDVLAQKDLGSYASSYTAPVVPAGGVVMLRIGGTDTPATSYQPSSLSGGAVYASCASCASGSKVTSLGSVVFSGVTSANAGGFVQIAYVNSGTQTLKAKLSVNGGLASTLAFPPSGSNGSVGTVTAYALLQAGQNTITLSSVDSATAAPDISGIATVAGPIALQPFHATYESEAANNTLSGGAVVANCQPCSGGRDVGYIGNGGTLVFNGVAAPSTASYTITIGYVNGDAGPRSAQVSFNGAAPVTVSFPSTGGWSSVGTLQVTGVLQSGNNTLTISNPSGWAPDIDGIAMASQQLHAKYEAEAANNTLSGGAVVANCQPCSGGKDVGYIGNGGTLTFNGIATSSAGSYTVTIGYANGDPGPRSAQVSFNGAAPAIVSFPPTGGWSSVGTVQVTGVFQNGNNTLTISNASGWAPDIDDIQ
ncbi:carbohydrate-binding protein [Collimonas humicola]|uniref:carbohydrate-binding protein n=1 Tax=Collimonas humicola TaxID=2825886 RepID=UPI001B8C4391|nr:carbohydrate-binding protein [Collimonas humicola]